MRGIVSQPVSQSMSQSTHIPRCCETGAPTPWGVPVRGPGGRRGPILPPQPSVAGTSSPASPAAAPGTRPRRTRATGSSCVPSTSASRRKRGELRPRRCSSSPPTRSRGTGTRRRPTCLGPWAAAAGTCAFHQARGGGTGLRRGVGHRAGGGAPPHRRDTPSPPARPRQWRGAGRSTRPAARGDVHPGAGRGARAGGRGHTARAEARCARRRGAWRLVR